MSEINFARYREYVLARVEANNAMIALLAGSRLAAHNLQLHVGSPHLLPGLFPAVRDIDRFNLLPDRASELLMNADDHLATVTIPYALATYEAFVKDAIGMLRDDGFTVPTSNGALNAGKMHTTFYTAADAGRPEDTLALFNVLRTVRNAHIHHGGTVTSEVRAAVAALTEAQRSQWERLTMRPADVLFDGGRIRLTLGHLVAAFAVTKSAARHINATLGTTLARTTWAALAVEDFAATSNHPSNSRQWKKGLLGHTRFNYQGGLSLNENELEAAARTSGHWTSPTW